MEIKYNDVYSFILGYTTLANIFLWNVRYRRRVDNDQLQSIANSFYNGVCPVLSLNNTYKNVLYGRSLKFIGKTIDTGRDR